MNEKHQMAALVALPFLAVLFCAGCQNYSFRQVKPLPIAVINQDTVINAQRGIPYLMIVQDTSYSMCEPIARDAGLDPDAGDYGYNYCAAAAGESKMGLTAAAMQQVLAGLDPTKNPFFLGLTSFPGPAEGCDVVSGAAVPLGDAKTTLSQISAWYGSIVGAEAGATPTAQTLAGPVASDPTFRSLDGGTEKYVLLITDGLPNCNYTNPCVYGSGNQYSWSDGVQRGCMSTAWLRATGGSNATPNDAALCSCAVGGGDLCVSPNPSDGSTYRNTCCIADPTVQGSDGGYPNAPVAASECLDADGSVQAITNLRALGITTYVVGMGYDYTNATVLDRMAQAGQNDPTATHYQADNPAQLAKTLHDLISFLAVSCIYPLDRTPQDARLIEVTLDGNPLALGDPNGFTYSTPGGVPTVNVIGAACATIKDGATHDLKIVALGQ
jgi:hypothetical protein